MSENHAAKKTPLSHLERKCCICGKKSKMTLGQARMAKAGRLISRCCNARFITLDQMDYKQKYARRDRERKRAAKLPVTAEMVKALLVGTGKFLERTKPYTTEINVRTKTSTVAKPVYRKKTRTFPAGWAITTRRAEYGIIFTDAFGSLGAAYVRARELAGLSTDISQIELELGVTKGPKG